MNDDDNILEKILEDILEQGPPNELEVEQSIAELDAQLENGLSIWRRYAAPGGDLVGPVTRAAINVAEILRNCTADSGEVLTDQDLRKLKFPEVKDPMTALCIRLFLGIGMRCCQRDDLMNALTEMRKGT